MEGTAAFLAHTMERTIVPARGHRVNVLVSLAHLALLSMHV